MSRRSKNLIAGLFLFLFAIPVVYIGLTWAPAHPLRFRAVLVPGNGAPVGWRNLELYVENTSLAPVHLLAFVQGPTEEYTMPMPSQMDPGLDPFGPALPIDHNAIVIPPGEELRLWRFIREADLQPGEDGQHWMQYACLSRTKHQALRCSRWLHAHSPRWLTDHLPELSLHYETTPLTVPPME